MQVFSPEICNVGRTTRFFQSKRESKGIAARRGQGATPPGGATAAQFTSIGFNLVRDGLDFRHLVEPGEEVVGQLAFGRRRSSRRRRGQREADDSRGPRKRCLVSMRGNDSKNESRIKSYGRFLNRFIPPQCRKAVSRSFLRGMCFLPGACGLFSILPKIDHHLVRTSPNPCDNRLTTRVGALTFLFRWELP